ncbi:hypothetical protein B0T19DRAFT_401329 [Cercophora scortea]|uniref:Uncharacterized protein n=1 Tax=Cercophora scortea TaxID=314031 RepID=A0AAE0IP22_9PEZI|nr:hypothetical protein B0T19DRAFT_401329 [Cercophora scortea]
MGVLRAFCLLALVQAVSHVEGATSTSSSLTTAFLAKITPSPEKRLFGNQLRRQASSLDTCYENAVQESHYSADVLVCSSRDPDCQTITWPDITAVAYVCGESSTTYTQMEQQLNQQLRQRYRHPRLPVHLQREAPHQEAPYMDEYSREAFAGADS